MPLKSFPIENVLTVYTGYCMKQGVGLAQDVFEHLWPGIYTLSCARLQPKAAAALLRQYPALGELPAIPEDGGLPACMHTLDAARRRFGDTLDIDGPLRDGEPVGVGRELAELTKARAS